MLDHLYVDGVDLTSFGVLIFDKTTRDAPKKSHVFYDVPGRDGSVLGVERRLENVDVDYSFIINENVDTALTSLRSYLLSRDGYVRIEDSEHSDEFRMGVYEGGMQVRLTRNRDKAKGVITFNCQPQRWLDSGDVAKTDTGSIMSDINPTQFEAKPLVKVSQIPSGSYQTIYFLGIVIEISDTYPADHLYIDCETQELYYTDAYGKHNAGYYCQVHTISPVVYGVDLPGIPPNSFDSIFTSGSSLKYELRQRWWTV